MSIDPRASQLPTQLWRPVRDQLAQLTDEQIAAVGKQALPDAEADCPGLRGLIAMLPRRSRDLIVWGCGVMAAVVECEAHNRMGADAITAVLAPVLMRGSEKEEGELIEQGADGEQGAPDPFAALELAQKAAARNMRLAAALLDAHMLSPLSH
mmetsp:Transcript_32898/g.65436  ORF Transcript_32898/g.65436 Transcript_32898/m.65436 type:complete len:153 (-) Transcript_32898:153-611(-)